MEYELKTRELEEGDFGIEAFRRRKDRAVQGMEKIENIEERLREIYPEKEAQRFVNSLRIILDIQSNYCNTNTRLEDRDRELELFREHLKGKKEFINEIDNFLKRISFGSRDKTNTIFLRWWNIFRNMDGEIINQHLEWQ